MELKSGLKGTAPFAAMVLVEWGEVGMITLAKAALNTGMSPFVYLVYYNSLGVLFLLPFVIFRTYRKKQPPLTLTLLFRFVLLGLFGRVLLMFGYLGLKYSSPALAAALANLVPVFTFLLAIIFRMEKLDMRSSSSIAKSLGTGVAVSGAFIVTLYKGPTIMSGTSHSSLHAEPFMPQSSNWALGGLLLAIGFCSAATWSILQAIFGIVFRYNIVTWCLHEKGPLYVAMFKPLGMVIAVTAGIMFLDDQLHLGSVIGAIIIAIGFYTVIWGQAKERKTQLKLDGE